MGFGKFAIKTTKLSTNISDSLQKIKDIKFVKRSEDEDLRPLHSAAYSGDEKLLQSLISQGNYPLEDQYDGGFTPLHLAVQEGNLAAAESLVENGANIDARTALDAGMIHLAAFGGHLDVVKFLVNHGADVNQMGQGGRTALHLAAAAGHLSIVRYLLERNADVNKADSDGWSAIQLALVVRNDLGVIECLLDHGADINAGNDSSGSGAVHIAAEVGDLDLTRCLVDHKADVNKELVDGVTALHFSAQNGHLEVTRYLIEHGADVNKADMNGGTPLQVSAQNGHHDITKYLLEQKADANKAEYTNGATALHFSARSGHLDVTKCLIEYGADVNKLTKEGFTALHYAALYGRLNVTKYLIDHKSDVDGQSNGGFTPLYVSAQNGHLDVTKYLVDHGADVNKEENEGFTALFVSALMGHLDVTKYLIDHKADVNKQSKDGRTALRASAKMGHLNVTKYLLDQNADVNKEAKDGATALHISVEKGHLGVTKCLIDHKADVNKKNKEGLTALHISAQGGHLDVAKYLIEHNADVNKEAMEGLTPLHISAGTGHLDVTKYLIDHKADVHKKDVLGFTALHVSAQGGHLDVTKHLISHNADVNKQTNDGNTALHLATQKGHFDVIKYLINHNADVTKQTENGTTALHFSVKYGYHDIAECLISDVANPKITKPYGKIVIEQNAGFNFNQRDIRLGFTALHLATHDGHTGIVESLVSHGADLNIQSFLGQTCLHHAIILCYICKFPWLSRDVKSTATLNRISTSIEEKLPLDRALVLYLLEQGASPHVRDRFEKTPMQYVWDNNLKKLITSRLSRMKTPSKKMQEIQIRLPRHQIEVRTPSSEFLEKLEIYVKELRKTSPDLILNDNEVLIASGLQMTSSNLNFSGPVKVTMAHCAKFSKPESADILLYTRQSSGKLTASVSAAEGVPRCVVREKDLDLYLDDLTECWITAVTERGFRGKRLMCTPYIPTSLRWNKADRVKLLVVDDLRLKEREIEGYQKACMGQELLVGWRKGDLTIRYLENKEEMETKRIKEKTFHSLVTHQLQFVLMSREKSEKLVDAMFSLEQSTDIKEIGFVLHFEDFAFDKKIIDDQGGELSVPPYGFTLIIPPGALKEGTSEEITLEVLTEIPDCIHLRDDEIIVSYGYECQPSGIQFRQPVSLVIPHCAVLGDPLKAEIALYSWNDLSKGAMRYSHKEINCKVSEAAFSLVLDHFCGGLFALLKGLFVKGKLMSCMPYLPKIMPSSRKPLLDVRLVNKPAGKTWQYVHREHALRNKKIRPVKDIDDEVLVRRDLTVSCQLQDEGHPQSQILDYSGLQHANERTAYFELNFDKKDLAINVALDLEQDYTINIKFLTAFEGVESHYTASSSLDYRVHFPLENMNSQGDAHSQSMIKQAGKEGTETSPNEGHLTPKTKGTNSSTKKDPGARPKKFSLKRDSASMESIFSYALPESSPAAGHFEIDNEVTEGVLSDLAEKLGDNRNLRKLALALGFGLDQWQLYKANNTRRDGSLGTEGTLEMLRDWKKKTSKSKQKIILSFALRQANLVELVEELLPLRLVKKVKTE